MIRSRHVFLCLVISAIVTEVSSLDGSQIAGQIQRLRTLRQNDNIQRFIQNATSGFAEEILQTVQTELVEYLSNLQSGTATQTNLPVSIGERLVADLQTRLRDSLQLRLQSVNGSGPVEKLVQNVTSDLASQLVNRVQTQLSTILPNTTIGNAELEERLQGLVSEVVSQISHTLRGQLQLLLSGQLNGRDGLDAVIQNITSSLALEIRTILTKQLQTYVTELINNTVSSFLAQTPIPQQLNAVMSDFLSSPELREILRTVVIGLVSDQESGVGIGETNATDVNRSDIVEDIIDLLADTITDNDLDLQQLMQNLTSNLSASLIDILQSQLSTLVPTISSGSSELDDLLQNLISEIVTQLTNTIQYQIQAILSGQLNLDDGLEIVLQNISTMLTNDLRQVVESQIQEYVSAYINNTVYSVLSQTPLPAELTSIITTFLSSPDLRELLTNTIVTLVTGEQGGVGSGLLFGNNSRLGTAQSGSQPAIMASLVNILRDALTELGAQTSSGQNQNWDNSSVFVQQLLTLLGLTSQSGSNDDTMTALLSTVGDAISVELIQDILTGSPGITNALAEALVSGTSGNLTNLIDTIAGLNVTDILAAIGNGNGSTNISAILELVQNSTVVQEGVTLVTSLVESAARSALKSNGVSESCQDGVQSLITGLLNQEIWAIQMLDAAGKLPSDVVGTTGFWKLEGSYDECARIAAPGAGGGGATLEGKYCRALVQIPAIPDIPGQEAHLTYGYCVPSSCETNDVIGIIDTAEGFLGNQTLPFSVETECEDDFRMETDAVIAICILVVLAVFMVIGTLYDVIAVQMGAGQSDLRRRQYADGIVNQGYVITDGVTIEKVQSMSKGTSKVKSDIVQETTTQPTTLYDADVERRRNSGNDVQPMVADYPREGGTDSKQDVPKLIKISEYPTANERSVLEKMEQGTGTLGHYVRMELHDDMTIAFYGVLEKMVLAFSVYSNGCKILNTEQGAGTLGAVNGVRFLSMAWVILGHTYFFAFGYSRNLVTHFVTKLNDWTFMSIAYATVAVDSFFAISGVLVAYLTLKELKRVKGARGFNWLLFYVHRFWRLTPPYMLVMMVGTVLLPYITSGPLWSFGEDLPFMANCRENWWTNLLYVNNLVRAKDLCMGWSWYLADDMQYYVISPLLLLPLFYHFAAGLGMCLLFLAGTITCAALITDKHEYHVQQFLPYAPAPKDGDELAILYYPSYNRMGPYIIGLFTGYLLYRWKNRCQIPKFLNVLLWLLSLGICAAVVYGPYSHDDDHVMSLRESVVFEGLHRTGWGVAVCWMVFSCACGHGGWINQVLSWKAFIPLGRLTYCAYLVHPLVMSVFINSRRQLTYFTDLEVAYMFLGHLCLAYGVAFVVSLAFESPMMGLEKAIIRNKK